MTGLRARTASAAIATLVGVLLSGCSSSGGAASDTNPAHSTGSASSQPLSRAAYKKLLSQIASEENRAQKTVQSALSASSVSDLRKGLLTFAADQDRVAHRLSSVTPPADAQSANTALANAFAANATATRQVAGKLGSVHSMSLAKKMINAATAARQSGQAIDSALAKLKRLGYTKGS
jgi:hypothetical protein